jgi:hypothetical protein
VTSMMTPPFSISARPTFTRHRLLFISSICFPFRIQLISKAIPKQNQRRPPEKRGGRYKIKGCGAKGRGATRVKSQNLGSEALSYIRILRNQFTADF